jgi:hypothetical protein
VVQKPDELLELEVKEEVGWDPVLDATRIVVNANDGKITLTESFRRTTRPCWLMRMLPAVV